MNKELDNRLLNSPEIAVDRAYLYFKKMATISMDNLNMALISFLNRDSNKRQEILKNEKTVEEMSKNLVGYLIKINGDNLTDESKKRISRLHLNLADIVRLSEIADNISGYTQNIVDGNLKLEINSTIGTMDEDIEIIKEGPDIMIAFNPKFIMDVLKVIDDEDISIYFINSKAPFFIKNDEGTYMYFIVPVLLNAVM